MKVLSVDPGFARCGIAIVEKGDRETLLYSACVETAPETPHEERLRRVADTCRDLIHTHAPEALALETLYFAKNSTTGLRVAEVRGAILAEAARAGIPVFEYAPSAVKVAVAGHGAARKEDIQRMIGLLLRVHKDALDDEFDAIAVGLTHLACARRAR